MHPKGALRRKTATENLKNEKCARIYSDALATMDTVFIFSDRTGLIVDSMSSVSKTTDGQMLNIASAANADRLDEARSREQGIEGTGAWDAYDVWRRFIKDARDQRKGRPKPGDE